MALLTCRDLCLGYDGREIVHDLNFKVESGDYLCIVGENGSGKSTLVKTILGLQSPISGEIIMSDRLKRTEIGYLPQQTVIQKDFPASVYEIVLSGCQNGMGLRPFYSKLERGNASYHIDLLGLTPLKRSSYRELSGGQQQRVLLARALCATKKMLLLDEPVSGLDPKVTAEMYDIIKSLNKKFDVSIIMISHDIDTALEYATHILHIGDKIFFGTKEEYQKSNFAKDFLKGGEE